MIREWCGKDEIIGNCRIPAVNDNNYAFNRSCSVEIYLCDSIYTLVPIVFSACFSRLLVKWSLFLPGRADMS